ncbi:MAG TPA: MarR family transcriptional regulator, partial [Xanthobacteraceae bacterium]|nr:MarR family transcriptional regulator [Xanthobacteraceae bacterium]
AMEKLGYVVRRQKPHNRKNIYIFLTPAGRALEAELVPLAVAVNTIAVAGLTRKQIAEFRKALVAIIKNLEN